MKTILNSIKGYVLANLKSYYFWTILLLIAILLILQKTFVLFFSTLPLLTFLLFLLFLKLISGMLFLRPVIGQWKAPSWVHKASKIFSNWQKPVFSLALLAFVGFGVFSLLPKKEPLPVAKVSLLSPSVTSYSKEEGSELKKTIYNLVLSFSDSVAPLEDIGKIINKNIKITPIIKGSWKWQNQATLIFEPEEDWNVKQKIYTVKLDKRVITPSYRLEQNKFNFSLEKIKAYPITSEKYEDPRDPKKRKIIFTMNFNYPVDQRSLSEKIQIKQVEYFHDKKEVSTELESKIILSEDSYTAYVHTSQISIPEKEGQVFLKLSKGVKSKYHDDYTKDDMSEKIRIPGLAEYFSMEDDSVQIISNKKNIPEHIASLNFSVGVSSQKLKSFLTIYQLPIKDKKGKTINWRRRKHKVQTSQLGTKYKKIPYEILPSAELYPKNHLVKIKPRIKSYIYYKISKGLPSASGYKLSMDQNNVLYAPEFPKQIKIMSNGSILNIKGDQKLSVLSVNVKKLKIEIGQVMDGQVQHLITQGSGNFQKPNFLTSAFDEKNLAQFYTEERTVNNFSKTDPSYEVIDFKKYLSNSSKNQNGLFFLKIKEKDGTLIDSRFILVTDLGIIVKKDNTGEHHVFVISLSTGKPIEGAKVDFIKQNGLNLFSAVSDKDGYVKFPKFVYKFILESPKGYLITKGSDLSFIRYEDPNRLLNYSRFSVGGQTNPVDNSQLNAFLFSDRGVYRPGEEVRIGYIVKSDNWEKDIKDVPINYEVINSRGKTIFKKTHKLSTEGLGEVIFSTERSSPTGEYSINVYQTKTKKTNRRRLGSIQIKVQEFLPDRLKIKGLLSKKRVRGWIDYKDIKLNVNLLNLFGIAAEGNIVETSFRIEPVNLYFKEYKDFIFDGPPEKERVFHQQVIGRQKTDQDGNTAFDIDLDKFAKGIFRLSTTAKGFEKESGRYVTSLDSTIVSPYSFLIGKKMIGDFDYIKKGDKRSLELIAIDSELKKIAANKIQIELKKITYENILTKQPNGSYNYQYVKKETIVSSNEQSFSEQGFKYNLDTKNAGEFILNIYNQNKILLSNTAFNIRGQADLSRSLNRNSELKVSLNKKDYSPGDLIEMEIKSPYLGAALISIEKDKVYSFKWITIEKKTSIQSITLPKGIKGNAFVNITLLRSKDSDAIYMSPFSFGAYPFSIDKSRNIEKIDLITPAEIKPGQELTVKYTTTNPSKVILFAVDEGILQFNNYKVPKPLDFFLTKKSMDTRTWQILDLILPEFSILKKSFAPGGDMQQAKMALGSGKGRRNPFKRKLKEPIAFWSGLQESSSTEKTWSFKVPTHFNGNLKIMAIAIGKKTMGHNSADTLVKADLIITPTVPYVMSPGEQMTLPVSVLNNIDNSPIDLAVSTSLETSDHFKIQGEKLVTANISPLKEKTHLYTVTAQDKLGAGTIKINSSAMGKNNFFEESISIRPVSPYLTDLSLGVLKKNKVNIPVDREVYTNFSTQELMVAVSPIAFANSLINFLNKNPYGCTEQILSQSFPHLLFNKYSFYKKSKMDHNQLFTQAQNMLRSRQRTDGSFNYYPSSIFQEYWLTLYVFHYLIEAKDRNYLVDKSLINKTSYFLKKELSKIPDDLEKAYAIYLLTRLDTVTTPYLLNFKSTLDSIAKRKKENKSFSTDNLVLAYIAASYKILRDEVKATNLINLIKLDNSKLKQVNYTFHNNQSLEKSRLLYIFANHFESKVKESDLVHFFSDLQKDLNTFSAAHSLLSIDAFNKNAETYNLNDLKITQVKKATQETLPTNLNIVTPFSQDATAIEIENKSDKPIFYSVTKAGFNLKPIQKSSGEFEVFKEFLDSSGKVVTKVKRGQELTVKIKFRRPVKCKCRNVAITDLLPTGFENILSKDGKPVGESGYTPDYVDVREDRVISYGAVGKDMMVLSYKVKPMQTGNFKIPATVLEDMYDLRFRATTAETSIEVTK